jgi:hypothetical protein
MTARRAALYASFMTRAKYLGRRKDGTVSLMRSKRSLNQATGPVRLGKVEVCLSSKKVRKLSRSFAFARFNRKRMDDSLVETTDNIVKSPRPLAKVIAESCSEILQGEKVGSESNIASQLEEERAHVVLDDRLQRGHPALETAVDEGSVVGDGVDSVSSGSVLLLSCKARRKADQYRLVGSFSQFGLRT